MSDLQRMIESQAYLQREAFDREPATMTDEQRMTYVRENVLALENELHEALAETGWKPWATSNHINTEAYLDELVDAFHFFMNLMLATGKTPGELADYVYKKYAEKSIRNVMRQKTGYDGITGKCPGCGRALDDEAVRCVRVQRGDGFFIKCYPNDTMHKVSP